jgi:hypothetical protein
VIMARHELGANSRSQYFGGWSSFFGAVMRISSLCCATLKRYPDGINATSIFQE